MTICDLGISNVTNYWNGFKTTISSSQASGQVKKVWCCVHQSIYRKLTICRHHQDHHTSTQDGATLPRGPQGHYQCHMFFFFCFPLPQWTVLIFSSAQFQMPCQGCLMQPWLSYLPLSIPFWASCSGGRFLNKKYILYCSCEWLMCDKSLVTFLTLKSRKSQRKSVYSQ